MLFGRKKPPPSSGESDPNEPNPGAGLGPLERRIFDLLLRFPERLDEMETRNEEHCASLARAIGLVCEEELRRRGGAKG